MLNQCQFIGNLGADVEVRSFSNGGRVANFRIAVTDKWKTKEGEWKEATEWVSIAIFNDGLVGVAEKYLRKGSKVFVQGKQKTRKWTDQQGNDRYSTEIVLQGFDGKLEMLDSRSDNRRSGNDVTDDDWTTQNGGASQPSNYAIDDLDDDVPF